MSSAASQPVIRLTEGQLAWAAQHLAERDPDLAAILEKVGVPPLWRRPPEFSTLIHIILEQQVSLASAMAAFRRLKARLGVITPPAFLSLSDDDLKAIGFSRQKTGYGRILAHSVLDGLLNLESLHGLTDDEVRSCLIRIKGIGRWTADIYLMEALLRPDVWPTGDLALAAAVRKAKRLDSPLNTVDLAEMGERWRPWRAVAARMFWHFYLNGNNPFAAERPDPYSSI